MGESAEAFLDQLVTWRELGLVFNARTPEYDEYESLPDWARETLEEHESDERPLWGKKILEWSPTPRVALETMIRLNDRWAVDGRDPNSYSGIFWCLGRFDRGWPERPVFGKVRSMSSDATRRKVSVTRYLERFAEKE